MDGGGEGCEGVGEEGEEEGEDGVHCDELSMRSKVFGWSVGFLIVKVHSVCYD